MDATENARLVTANATSYINLASYLFKAWFPLNVSVLATDRSCLLARTSLRWPGFHRQASQGLLRGLLHQRYVNRAAHSVFNHK